MNRFLFAVALCSITAAAQEPGYLINESPAAPRVESPAPLTPIGKSATQPEGQGARLTRSPRTPRQPFLAEQFAHARGLKNYEIQTIHYNRISCDRRIFTASGHSVEGDGDLKAVSVPPDFIEVEFPSHVGFESFQAVNPYQNGLLDLETATSRQLVNVREWTDGKSLILNKKVHVRFTADKPSQTVPATVEIKVKDGTYPSTYIIRETIEIEPKFNLYFICQ